MNTEVIFKMVSLKSLTNFALKSEADIFAMNPVQNTVHDSTISPYRPISLISEAGPIELCIPASMDYIDISNTTVHLIGKVVKIDNTDFGPDDNDAEIYAPVNLPVHSIFEKIVVSFNKKVVCNSSNYPYRAIIETLTNFSTEAKNTHIQSQIFFKDDAKQMDNMTGGNTGFENRKRLTGKSQEFEIIAPLHLDVCNQAKYLLNGVEVSFKFYPNNKSEFYMMGNVHSKIKIVDINLIVRKVKLHPQTIEAHAKVLQQESAKYPINRTEIKTFTLSSGLMSKNLDNIYLGAQPNRVIVALVSTKSFDGDYTLNPYNFQNFNLSEIGVFFDNQPLSGMPIHLDFENGKFALGYQTLFSGTGRNFSDTGCGISPDDFKNGYAIFCFDLTVDQSSSAQFWSIQKTGNLSIQLKFGKPLQQNVTALIFSEFDNLIEIDKFRNITIDYPC